MQRGEEIGISSRRSVFFQISVYKPTHVLELPGPRIVQIPALLNGDVHDLGLPEVALPGGA